jgi:hypothetical protein
MRSLAVALAAVGLAAGCGGGGGGGGGGKPGAGSPVALLTGAHASGAKVVFDFQTPPEGVETRFRRPARVAEAGSGRHVPVRGTSVLVVSFTPAATAEVRGEEVVPTYTGPKRLRAPGPVLEVVKVGDFESRLEWAIGLADRRPFRLVRNGARVAVVFEGVG